MIINLGTFDTIKFGVELVSYLLTGKARPDLILSDQQLIGKVTVTKAIIKRQDFTPGQARLDVVPLVWERLTLGQDAYLVDTLSTGRHHLVVESL